MKILPIYKDFEKRALIETIPPRKTDSSCQLCSYSVGEGSCRKPRMSGKFQPGGILVLGGQVSNREMNSVQGPFSDSSGQILQNMIRQYAPEIPIIFDKAIRCPERVVADEKPADTSRRQEEAIRACQPYLANLIKTAKPSRILVMGPLAKDILLGFHTLEACLHESYTMLSDGTPVFLLPDHENLAESKFAAGYMEKHVKFAMTGNPEAPPWDLHYLEPETTEEALEALDTVFSDPDDAYSLDAETSGMLFSQYFRLLCVAVSPVYGTDRLPVLLSEVIIRNPQAIQRFSEYFLSRKLSAYNAQFDIKILWWKLGLLDGDNNAPIDQTNLFADPMWAWKQRGSAAFSNQLSDVAPSVGMGGMKHIQRESLAKANSELSGHVHNFVNNGGDLDDIILLPTYERNTILGACLYSDVALKNPEQFSHGLVNPGIEYPYCVKDTVANARLTAKIIPDIMPVEGQEPTEDQLRMHRLWKFKNRPAVLAFAQTELYGMSATAEPLYALHALVSQRIKQYDQIIVSHGFPADGNIGSNTQLASFLYEKKGYPILGTTESGAPSVSAEVLDELAEKRQLELGHADPLIEAAQERAVATKVLSTYTLSLAKFIAEDGKIHGNLRPEGTETGRPAAKDPNLFNLVSRSEYKNGIKSAFIPTDPETQFIAQEDFSAVEVRCAAALANDEAYIEAFANDVDPHMATAYEMVDLTNADAKTKKEARGAAKCYHPNTEVYTTNGWKLITSVRSGEEILCCTPGENGTVTGEFKVPQDIFTEQHPSQKLLLVKGKGLNFAVTPDHGVLVYDPEGRPHKVRADELATLGYQPRFVNRCTKQETNVSAPQPQSLLWNYNPSGLATLLGLFFVAQEAKLIRYNRDTQTVDVTTKTCEDSLVRAIVKLLRQVGISSSGVPGCTNTVRIREQDAQNIFAFDKAVSRFEIPWFLMHMSSEIINAFFAGISEAMTLFVRIPASGVSGLSILFREDLCNFLTYIGPFATKWMFSAGKSSTGPRGVVYHPTLQEFPSDTVVVKIAAQRRDSSGVNGAHADFVNAYRSDEALFDPGPLKIETTKFVKRVACVTVDSGYVLTRYQGCPLICGNTVVFGVLYGKSVKSLSKDLRKPDEEGQRIYDSLMDVHVGLRDFIEAQHKFVRENGFVYTFMWDMDTESWLTMDKRIIHQADSTENWALASADRVSVNTPIQGTAAIRTVMAFCNVVFMVNRMRIPGLRVINMIYDSVILNVPKKNGAEILEKVRQVMQGEPWGRVKLVVDLEVGANWAKLTSASLAKSYTECLMLGMSDLEAAMHLELVRDQESYTASSTADVVNAAKLLGYLE